MLILSRKLHEAIRVADNIRIIIMETTRNRVRIAIDAPECVPILREELWLRRQEFVDAGQHEEAAELYRPRK